MNEKKKVIVMGGGLSGLTAAYLLCKNSYDVTIIEKNHNLGGYCTTYIKDETIIDVCIHYLSGYRNSALASLYKELGFFDNAKIIKYPNFFKFYYENKVIEVSRDFSLFKKQLLKLALPIDIKPLKKFFNEIKTMTNFPIKLPKPFELMLLVDYITFIKQLFPSLTTYLSLSKQSVKSYANKFQTPIIKEFICSMYPNNISIVYFIGILSWYFSSNADTVDITSKEVVENITKKIQLMGAKIKTNEEIIKLDIKDNSLSKIYTKFGEYQADYYISALPLTYLYSKLLPKEYHDERIDATLFDVKNNNIISACIPIFKVDDKYKEEIENYFIINVKDGFKCIKSINKSIGFKYYEHFLNPDKSHTLNCIIDQNEDDYKIWMSLSDEDYKKEKKKIVNDVKKVLFDKFPNLKEHLKLVDVITPKSLYNYTYNLYGSYMSNMSGPQSNRSWYKYSSEYVNNLFYASIWVSQLGGIPSALSNGEGAFLALNKKELLNKKKR